MSETPIRLVGSVAPSVRVPAVAWAAGAGRHEHEHEPERGEDQRADHDRRGRASGGPDAAAGVARSAHVSPGQVTLLMTESARP